MQLNEVASHVKIVKSTGAIYPTKIFGPPATDNKIHLFLIFSPAKVQNK